LIIRSNGIVCRKIVHFFIDAINLKHNIWTTFICAVL